ncbi:hypothetical protein AAFF_G00042430 [Aldrovandia affinis]|uniref:Uncharacterized protein n=1 Tax=Aldrovandia affinis TaxID=143900 RepID=A0AAD7WFH2_9TELE|nr:hypothetical protein AAFF_G00042430 [Aldrovandia affinis]
MRTRSSILIPHKMGCRTGPSITDTAGGRLFSIYNSLAALGVGSCPRLARRAPEVPLHGHGPVEVLRVAGSEPGTRQEAEPRGWNTGKTGLSRAAAAFPFRYRLQGLFEPRRAAPSLCGRSRRPGALSRGSAEWISDPPGPHCQLGTLGDGGQPCGRSHRMGRDELTSASGKPPKNTHRADAERDASECARPTPRV